MRGEQSDESCAVLYSTGYSSATVATVPLPVFSPLPCSFRGPRYYFLKNGFIGRWYSSVGLWSVLSGLMVTSLYRVYKIVYTAVKGRQGKH